MNQLSFVSHDLSVSSVKTDVIWTISNYEVFLFARKVLAMVCLKNDVFSFFFYRKTCVMVAAGAVISYGTYRLFS